VAPAEAVVGFINAYQLTCDADFLDAALKTWDFIKNHLVDKFMANVLEM
jgi:mannobiose 2-epimerase